MRGIPPGDRGIGMVFQDQPLLPHLDVRDNIAFGLRLLKVPALEVAGRIAELAEPLGIAITFFRDRLGRVTNTQGLPLHRRAESP